MSEGPSDVKREPRELPSRTAGLRNLCIAAVLSLSLSICIKSREEQRSSRRVVWLGQRRELPLQRAALPELYH